MGHSLSLGLGIDRLVLLGQRRLLRQRAVSRQQFADHRLGHLEPVSNRPLAPPLARPRAGTGLGRWCRPELGAGLTIDLDARITIAHSEKVNAAKTWKKTFGFHPLLAYLDRPDVSGGEALAGRLAPRAAAYEHRLAACVAVDGVYDLGQVSTTNFPGSPSETVALLRAESAPEADAAIDAMMVVNPTARWAITHGSYVMGTATPRAFLASYLDYTLDGGIAEQITCPTLVCDAEEDLFFAGQPEQLFDHLTCPRTLMRFTTAEGAGAHCHSGAQRTAFARIFDWLDTTLASVPSPSPRKPLARAATSRT